MKTNVTKARQLVDSDLTDWCSLPGQDVDGRVAAAGVVCALRRTRRARLLARTGRASPEGRQNRPCRATGITKRNLCILHLRARMTRHNQDGAVGKLRAHASSWGFTEVHAKSQESSHFFLRPLAAWNSACIFRIELDFSGGLGSSQLNKCFEDGTTGMR